MASPPPQGGGPTPEQLAQMRAAVAAEAARRGMTVEQFQAEQKAKIEAEAQAAGVSTEEYIKRLQAMAVEQHKRMMEAQQQGQQQGQEQGPDGAPAQQQQQAAHQHDHQHQHQHQHQQQQQVPIQPTGPPNPQALALAKFLMNQDLKMRTCILNGQRKEMFKVKRALRAIESPAYDKAAAKKKSLLPPKTEAMPSAEIFKLLPLSLLALRVTKIDPHEGHAHGPTKKRVKGLWTVKIEQNQEVRADLHYAWLYDGPQTKQKVYAGLALLGVLALVCFPLWPVTLRIGVWYLSMGMLGLIGLFFVMAIFRLILFCITVFTVPPGLWLYPNLFEDVGFFDSFRPVWGWNEDPKAARKAKREARKVKQAAKVAKGQILGGGGDGGADANEAAGEPAAAAAAPAPAGESTAEPNAKTSSANVAGDGQATHRSLAPRVEEVEDSD